MKRKKKADLRTVFALAVVCAALAVSIYKTAAKEEHDDTPEALEVFSQTAPGREKSTGRDNDSFYGLFGG